MTPQLQNVFIAGGVGNIGFATSELFAERGYNVIAADIADERAELLTRQPRMSYLHMDFTDYKSIKDGFESISDQYKTLTHVVWAAGWTHPGEIGKNIEELDQQTIEDSVKLNLMGPMYLMSSAIPLMKGTHDRSITLVSSVDAIIGYDYPIYSATKAGLLGLATGSLRELGKKGIRINNVLPGTVPNEKTRTQNSPEWFEKLEASTTVGRLGVGQDIAAAIYFLATHTWMAGAQLVVDGGEAVKGKE